MTRERPDTPVHAIHRTTRYSLLVTRYSLFTIRYRFGTPRVIQNSRHNDRPFGFTPRGRRGCGICIRCFLNQSEHGIIKGLFGGMVLQRDRRGVCDGVIAGRTSCVGPVKAMVEGRSGKFRFADRVIGRAARGSFTARLSGLPAGGP